LIYIAIESSLTEFHPISPKFAWENVLVRRVPFRFKKNDCRVLNTESGILKFVLNLKISF